MSEQPIKSSVPIWFTHCRLQPSWEFSRTIALTQVVLSYDIHNLCHVNDKLLPIVFGWVGVCVVVCAHSLVSKWDWIKRLFVILGPVRWCQP